MKLIKKVFNHISWRLNQLWYIYLPQKYFSLFIPKIVMSGPFKGMKYLNESFGSVILPKLIGTYEDELHELFTTIKETKYRRFIDIGAAEGYYAVGFNKYLFPEINETVAFEASAKGRKLIKKLADKNNTSVIIKGFCTIEALSSTLNSEKTIVLVDIEGGEFELLDPNKIDFKSCDIIVEVHYKNGINKESDLIEKFHATHDISVIETRTKKLPESVSWNSVITNHRDYFLNEFRGAQTWLFIKSKSKLV